MGKGPKAPDPYKQAAAQRQENIWTSQYNTIGQNANQYTPYGSVTNAPGAQIPIYDQNGNQTGWGTQWNQTTSLSPQEQAIFDQEQQSRLGLGKFANQQIGTLTDVLGKPFNAEGLQPWMTYGAGPALRKDSGPTDRAAIEQAMMESYQRGTQPTYDAQDAQYAARGMAPGSKYYGNVQRERGDALGEATRQAYLGSGQESRAAQEAYNKVAQQDWMNEYTRADKSNQLRGAQFGERAQERNQIVNEIAALMGGSQVTVPQGQAFQGSSINPFDIAGAIQNKYSQDQASYQNKMNGIFGIASGVLGMINPLLGAGMGAAGGLVRR